MQTEMSMRENGTMIKLKEEDHMNIWMEQNISEIGKKIDNMAME